MERPARVGGAVDALADPLKLNPRRIERRWIRFRRRRPGGWRIDAATFKPLVGRRIPFPIGPPDRPPVPYTGLLLQVDETPEWLGLEFTAIERERVEDEED